MQVIFIIMAHRFTKEQRLSSITNYMWKHGIPTADGRRLWSGSLADLADYLDIHKAHLGKLLAELDATPDAEKKIDWRGTWLVSAGQLRLLAEGDSH